MVIYGGVRATIEAEAALPLGKRTQSVPCAFCTRGGNGDQSCACGWKDREFDLFKGCFSGELLAEDPTEGGAK